MCKGFIKIPRRLFETRWWNQKRIYSESDAIIDIFQSAGRGNTFSTSLRTLADRWIWNQMKVSRFLERLQKDGYISIAKNDAGTLIKIVDCVTGVTPSVTPSVTPKTKKCYTKTPINKGLDDGQCYTQPVTSVTPSVTPSVTVSRAYKNDIIISCLNKKNIRTPYNPPRGYESYDFSFVDDSFKAVLFDWLIYKIERKDKKYTERGLKAFYTRLTKLSLGNAEAAREIVEQSYANNWSGIFELKEHATDTGYHQDADHPSNGELLRQTADLVAQMAEERRNRQEAVRQRP